jgi:hypothetical protein
MTIAVCQHLRCHQNHSVFVSLCSICDQLKKFAQQNSFRTVDLRSAIRDGQINSSHLLSEDCFVEVMKAHVRGDSGLFANRALQAGARAERMSKRNRE